MNKFPNIFKVITDATVKTNGKSVVVGRNAQNTHQRLTSPSCLRSIMLDVAASSQLPVDSISRRYCPKLAEANSIAQLAATAAPVIRRKKCSKCMYRRIQQNDRIDPAGGKNGGGAYFTRVN